MPGAAPNLLSSPLVLTCTRTGSGSRPTASTALSSLLASCAPQKSTFWFTDRLDLSKDCRRLLDILNTAQQQRVKHLELISAALKAVMHHSSSPAA